MSALILILSPVPPWSLTPTDGQPGKARYRSERLSTSRSLPSANQSRRLGATMPLPTQRTSALSNIGIVSPDLDCAFHYGHGTRGRPALGHWTRSDWPSVASKPQRSLKAEILKWRPTVSAQLWGEEHGRNRIAYLVEICWRGHLKFNSYVCESHPTELRGSGYELDDGVRADDAESATWLGYVGFAASSVFWSNSPRDRCAPFV